MDQDAGDGSDAALGGTEALGQPGPQGDGRGEDVVRCGGELDPFLATEIENELLGKDVGEGKAGIDGEGAQEGRQGWPGCARRIR